MRKILFLIIGAAFSLNMMAQTQIDRSKQPKPGPAPTITIKDPFIEKLPNGITLIVVENHKLPKVAATFSIDRGPIVEGKKAGVNGMMGGMLGEGTTKNPKDKFDAAVDQMGANVNLFESGGSVSALGRYFEKAFLLMAEALQNPAFPQESFEKLKSQKLTSLKSNEKSASAISGRVIGALSYGKNSAMGEFETEESIKALSLDDIKKAYKDYITPSRSYLTFVGDITPDAAKALAMKAFGTWKGTKLTLAEIPNVENVKSTEINFVDLPTAVQGEINITNLINNPLSNPDYHALMIANQILGGGAESKLFMNLREKHGFTYGSYTSVGNGRFQEKVTSSAKVRSEKADSAVAEIINEISNMRDGKITKEELENAKAKYNGSFALGMEDPERTASYATNILINNLPKDYYKTFLQKINAVTVEDVRRAAKKYFMKDNCRIVIVGNASKILPNLTRLGYPIKKYDKYAEPVLEKPKELELKETSKTSDAVSAASIIDEFLKAIGGKEEVKKFNTLKASFTMEIQGMSLKGTDIKMAPNKQHTEIKMGEMKVMEKVFDGTKGYQAQSGQKKEMDEKEIKEAQDEKALIPQLYYISQEYQVLYIGTDKVGNEEAYKLKVTAPSGKVSVEFFSTKTGLLIRDEITMEGEGGGEVTITADYSNYKKAGNVLLPFTTVRSFGEQEMTFNIDEVSVNEGVTDADFKVD
jgi:predicted Zn-dependent peptidase